VADELGLLQAQVRVEARCGLEALDVLRNDDLAEHIDMEVVLVVACTK
jgi:hypothetical protein